MRARWLTVSSIGLLAGVARAGPPAVAPAPAAFQEPAPAGAVTHALLAALNLPVHVGDSWGETEQQLYAMRCLPEESVLFSAMDCRSNLTLGPFSAAGPEGDGLTVYSDDGAAVTRVSASRSTTDHPHDCPAFLAGVSRALARAGVPSKLERRADGVRLRAGEAGDLRLVVECKPTVQTLELAEPWLYLVPGGNCPGLREAQPELRALADSAMTGEVHGSFDDPGTACNRPEFELSEYAGQLMNGLMAASAALKDPPPGSPPDWLVTQIRGGLANVRAQAAALKPDPRRRFEAFLARESTPAFLDALWVKMMPHGQLGQPGSGSAAPAAPRKHH